MSKDTFKIFADIAEGMSEDEMIECIERIIERGISIVDMIDNRSTDIYELRENAVRLTKEAIFLKNIMLNK